MEAEEAVEAVEAVEVVEVVEAVEEDLPPHNHLNSHSNNRMLPQQRTSKQWENSRTHLMATVPKQKTSSKK